MQKVFVIESPDELGLDAWAIQEVLADFYGLMEGQLTVEDVTPCDVVISHEEWLEQRGVIEESGSVLCVGPMESGE